MRRATLGVLAAVASGVTLALCGGGAARADFAVGVCGGGAPAAPWTLGLGTTNGFAGTVDRCNDGTGLGFLIGDPSGQAPGEVEGAGIQIPSGEVLTHVAASYHTLAAAGGGGNFTIGYGNGSTPTFIVSGLSGDAHVGTHVDQAIPGATQLDMRLFCTNQAGCAYGGAQVVTIGAMTLTLRDTAPPAVQPAASDLASSGVRRGRQTLAYSASDAGSGVAHVTVALGTTVLADVGSPCQPGSLRPCPPSVSGVVTIDTARVPDGTYPVLLTADDASGDPASVQVSRISVRNHSGTQTLLTPGPPRVRVKLLLGWRWTRTRTTLTSLRVRRLGRRAHLTIACAGRRCPFRHRSTTGHGLSRLVHRMVGTRFRPAQRLTVTVSQPHHRAEHARLLIRRDREPRVLRRR